MTPKSCLSQRFRKTKHTKKPPKQNKNPPQKVKRKKNDLNQDSINICKSKLFAL